MATFRKFSSYAAPEMLDALRQIGLREGRSFHAVLREALREYVARRQHRTPPPHVREAFRQSIQERHELYKLLAKPRV